MTDLPGTMRQILDLMARLELNHHTHAARQVHMHPTMYAAILADPRTTRTYGITNLNTMIGLDIITTSGQAPGSYRITDRHGCILSDSRSGRRHTPTGDRT